MMVESTPFNSLDEGPVKKNRPGAFPISLEKPDSVEGNLKQVSLGLRATRQKSETGG